MAWGLKGVLKAAAKARMCRVRPHVLALRSSTGLPGLRNRMPDNMRWD